MNSAKRADLIFNLIMVLLELFLQPAAKSWIKKKNISLKQLARVDDHPRFWRFAFHEEELMKESERNDDKNVKIQRPPQPLYHQSQHNHQKQIQQQKQPETSKERSDFVSLDNEEIRHAKISISKSAASLITAFSYNYRKYYQHLNVSCAHTI